MTKDRKMVKRLFFFVKVTIEESFWRVSCFEVSHNKSVLVNDSNESNE